MKTLDEYKKELLNILKKQAKPISNIEKSLIALCGDFLIEKGKVANIGEVRTWGNRKFRKIAQGKWRPIYESESRGAKQSIRIIAGKIKNAKSTDELLEIVMQNVNRFQDENGKILPIVEELKNAVNEKKQSLNVGKPSTQEQIDKWNKEHNQKTEENNEPSNLDDFSKWLENKSNKELNKLKEEHSKERLFGADNKRKRISQELDKRIKEIENKIKPTVKLDTSKIDKTHPLHTDWNGYKVHIFDRGENASKGERFSYSLEKDDREVLAPSSRDSLEDVKNELEKYVVKKLTNEEWAKVENSDSKTENSNNSFKLGNVEITKDNILTVDIKAPKFDGKKYTNIKHRIKATNEFYKNLSPEEKEKYDFAQGQEMLKDRLEILKKDKNVSDLKSSMNYVDGYFNSDSEVNKMLKELHIEGFNEAFKRVQERYKKEGWEFNLENPYIVKKSFKQKISEILKSLK